jgi:hypothetical protein
MKKILLSGTLVLILGFQLFSQQVQNPGFETWENAGTDIDEPVDWSSIKTSDNSVINPLAPIVWGQSTDAHTGTYSLELFNVLSMGTFVVTGTITNGRVHAEFDPSAGYIFTDPNDEQWHTVLTERPDSVVVWAKYTPQGNDTAQVKVLLHINDGTLPPSPENQANWIAYSQINITGTVDTWTRFSMPFNYFSEENPQYMLIVATAGSGFSPQEGSIVLLDDFELIYNSTGIQEKPNDEMLIYAAANHTIVLNNFARYDLQGSTLELFTTDGALILRKNISSNRTTIDPAVNGGLYLIRITGKDWSYSQKLLLK